MKLNIIVTSGVSFIHLIIRSWNLKKNFQNVEEKIIYQIDCDCYYLFLIYENELITYCWQNFQMPPFSDSNYRTSDEMNLQTVPKWMIKGGAAGKYSKY